MREFTPSKLKVGESYTNGPGWIRRILMIEERPDLGLSDKVRVTYIDPEYNWVGVCGAGAFCTWIYKRR